MARGRPRGAGGRSHRSTRFCREDGDSSAWRIDGALRDAHPAVPARQSGHQALEGGRQGESGDPLPVSVEGRIAIPRGSFVTATITRIKAPGRGSSRAELTIRFETLTLPNGVTRGIQSWVGGVDDVVGKVDREAGKITGERNPGDDARTADGRASAGAFAGSLAGAVTGAGSEAGWVVGAAAGLASVLVSRGPDVVLRQGTMLEMVLDRDLRYKPEELKF